MDHDIISIYDNASDRDIYVYDYSWRKDNRVYLCCGYIADFLFGCCYFYISEKDEPHESN